jgi:hypothetical protein
LSGKDNPSSHQDYLEAARDYDKLSDIAKAKVDDYARVAGAKAAEVKKARNERK